METTNDLGVKDRTPGYMDTDSKIDIHETEAPCVCSQRWILGYLGFAYGAVLTIFRIDMSIAVVCMTGDAVNTTQFPHLHFTNSSLNVNGTSILQYEYNTNHSITFHNNDAARSDIKNNSNSVLHLYESRLDSTTDSTPRDVTPVVNIVARECEDDGFSHQGNLHAAEFSWDKSTQAVIVSAFFYGFVASQIPGSYLTGWFGGKTVATVCFTAASILTLLLPLLARVHVYGIIIARILIGICSGPLPPAWFSLLGRWALPNERSRLIMFFWFGQSAGAVIGYITSGYLCTHGFDNGWGSIFYTHGAVGILYTMAWAYFVSDSPNTHPRITEAERKLLEKHLHHTNKSNERVTKVPWRKILSSLPVWAIFITQLCDNWMYYLVLTCLPMFVREILRFDIQSNGFYSSLPFIASIISVIPAGIAADYFNERRWFSRTTNRKLFQITSLIGSAIFLVVSGYITCDQRTIAILYICLSQLFLSVAIAAAYPCNLIDMTPRYASFLYSVSNTLGASTGFIAPLVMGLLTENNTLAEWRNVFWISAGISVFGAVVYGLFSSSELLPWDGTYERHIELEVSSTDKNVDHTAQLLSTDESNKTYLRKVSLT